MKQLKSVSDQYFSREAFQAWRALQPSGRFERVDGHIYRMSAERVSHVRVKGNVYLALRQAVKAAGLPCEVLTDGVTIEAEEGDYEPDATVNCGATIPADALAAPNPIIVVEVLSPGTANTDTGIKLAGYFGVKSIMHYLIVHPTQRTVIHHRRMGDRLETTIVATGPIVMDPPGLTITVEELHDNR